MNIFHGEIKDCNFHSLEEDFVIELKSDRELLKPLKEKVAMGIRSERFIAGEAEKNAINVKVDVIEMLGKEQLLYCQFPNGKECVISEPGYFEYAVDEDHNFHLDLDGLHFFDAETTERIN